MSYRSATVHHRIATSHTAHVVTLLLSAVLVRLLLFDWVGIWADYGFYIYDSRLILQGQTPFVDFLGRSPLFNYAFAAVRGVFGHPIPLLRAFISAVWLATAMPVYLLARHITDHRVGLAALALFALSPFALVYGMWANTQSLAALLAVTAVYAALRADHDGWFVAVGALFALAYLSRRSVFVIAGGVGLWLLVRLVRHRDYREFGQRCVALAIGGVVTLLACYAALVGLNVQQTWALFETHTLSLFFSHGRGGYPLLGVDPPLVTNTVSSGRIPIFNDLCQVCGAWTARTFAKTILVALPAVALLGWYLRDWTATYLTDAQEQYLLGSLGALALYAAARTLLVGYPMRTLAIIGIVGIGGIIYLGPRVPRADLYDRRLQVVLLVLVGLTAGYLYRNRVLHTYYFMDFWPYLSVVAGLVAVRAWDRLHGHLRTVFVMALVLSTVAAGASAHPLTNVALDDNEDGWFTQDNLQAISADVNARTDAGDEVLVTSPGFLSDTHARAPNDNARVHMVLARYENTGPGIPLYDDLIRGVRSGDYEYVIFSRTTRDIMLWNATLRRGFLRNYCHVARADDVYTRAGGRLYRYAPTNCSAARRPTLRLPNPAESSALDRVRKNPVPQRPINGTVRVPR